MARYPKIWFLRHGQTEWNKAYRLQGQLDSPLTAQGLAEARRQALILPPILALNPAVFVSPLGRARQTADIALGGVNYVTDDRLMEIHAGQGQGMHRNEVMGRYLPHAKGTETALSIYAACKGAETIPEFHNRIRSFMADLTGPTVVVAHGLLGQVMRAEACGLPIDAAGHLSNQQGCVYVLDNGTESTLETADA